jgi:CheY-like chemotaxis protein
MMEDEGMSCFTVLMADDDADDRFLFEQAFLELESCGDLRFVEDGEELMDYLRRSGKYADPAASPRPALILLDLNMPRRSARCGYLSGRGIPGL